MYQLAKVPRIGTYVPYDLMNIASPPKVAALPVILPKELIGEVLSLLPVKSLMRMKCVCMSWKTLISNLIFVKLHLKKQSTQNTTHFALLLRDNINGSSSVVSVSVSHLLESTSKSITLPDNPYYGFRFGFAFEVEIVGSCNGLICLESRYFTEEHSLYLWNPATRTKSKPFRSYHNPLYNMLWFGFGYDNSTDTYKVVVLSFNKDVPSDLQVRPTARVFTFGDNIWRDIQSFPVVVLLHRHNCFDEQNGVYLSNSTNWLVRSQYNCRLKNLTIEQFVIISLDLGTETYTKFLLPQCCDEVPLDRSTLRVLMDCLCFSYNFKNTHLVLWQMKEFGVEESWTQFLKISYLNLQVQVYCFMDTSYVSHLTPLCLSENGDTLIFAIDNSEEAILYDLRNNRVKRTVNTYMIKMCTVNGYFESLVSTC